MIRVEMEVRENKDGLVDICLIFGADPAQNPTEQEAAHASVIVEHLRTWLKNRDCVEQSLDCTVPAKDRAEFIRRMRQR